MQRYRNALFFGPEMVQNGAKLKRKYNGEIRERREKTVAESLTDSPLAGSQTEEDRILPLLKIYLTFQTI